MKGNLIDKSKGKQGMSTEESSRVYMCYLRDLEKEPQGMTVTVQKSTRKFRRRLASQEEKENWFCGDIVQ